MKIASKIGSDVAFFASGFKSANVSGTGEIVAEFSDEVPNLSVLTSDIFCSTPRIYAEFRKTFNEQEALNSANLANELIKKSSKEIIENYENYELNDLLKPCLALHQNLVVSQDEFLSGSGSAKFRQK